MTAHDYILEKMASLEYRHIEPRGLVVGPDIYHELCTDSITHLICAHTQLTDKPYMDSYRGLEVSVSKREGALVVY